MSADPLLSLGVLACCLLAAASLPGGTPRRRLAFAAAGLLLAPVLVVADNWTAEAVRELRERPLLAVAAASALAAAIAALTFAFMRRPALAPLALVATLALRIPVTVGESTANLLLPLYVVLAAALAAAWLQPALLAAPPVRRLRALPWALAVFVVLFGLQAALAADLSGAVEAASFFLAPFAALFVLLSSWRWDGRLARLAVLVLIAEMIVVSLVGFVQFATGELFWNDKVIAGNEAHAWFRVNSLFYDPNIMGRYLFVAMIFAAAVACWRGGRERQAATVGFVIMLAALVLTFSQTAFLGLLAGMLALGFLRWGLLPAAAATAATIAVLAFGVVAIGGSGNLEEETTGRTGLISGGLELAAERPLAGWGSGTFPDEFERRFGAEQGEAVVSHTEPVTVAAEQGTIGLAAYVAVLAAAAMLLAASLRARRGGGHALMAAVTAGFVAMVAHSMGYAAFFTDPLTWSLLALAWAGAVRPAAAS